MDAQSPPRTLIADDQADVLEALRLLLKAEGHQIETASSPKMVLDALATKDYDLLLLDMNYTRDTTSGQEGLDLLERIHSIDESLPVILMTAWGSIDLAVQAMRNGGRHFVQKPWDNAKLLSLVQSEVFRGRVARRARGSRVEIGSSEVRESRELHERLVPENFPDFAGVSFSKFWMPARTIGGDYYDVIARDDFRGTFCIADVAGKGLPAALLMSSLQATLRSLPRDSASDPGRLLTQTNDLVRPVLGPDRFITLLAGAFDTAAGELAYASAGHLPGFLIHTDGTHEVLDPVGSMLGIFPGQEYRTVRLPLRSGDRLILYTDGVVEARNESGMEFGIRRLLEAALDRRSESAESIRIRVVEAASNFCSGHFEDDVTLLVAAFDF